MKKCMSIVLSMLMLLSSAIVSYAEGESGISEIRYDFETGTQNVSNTSASSVVSRMTTSNGALVLSTVAYRNLAGKQIQFELPQIDLGDGGYHLYMKAKYEFPSALELKSTFVGYSDTQKAEYPSVGDKHHSTWEGYKELEFDISKLTGKKYIRLYFQLTDTSSYGSGKVYVDSIVLSKAESGEKSEINLGSPSYEQTQGENGWYLCYQDSASLSELVWDYNSKGWYQTTSGTGTYVESDEMSPTVGKDLVFKFVPNMGGLYTLTWDPEWKFKNSDVESGKYADGMTLSLVVNNTTMCTKNLALEEVLDCTMTVMLEEGDEVLFKVDANNEADYDAFTGFPNVDLVGIFYQKNENGMTELTRDRCNVVYIADDDLARISQEIVMPTDEYSLVRRYLIPADGRYRIYGKISSKDKNGGGNVIRIYKNDELLREQVALSGEDTLIDLRVLCEINDKIDIEVEVAEYEGFNYSKWDVKIENIPGTIRDCETTTTAGYTYGVLSSALLSDYIAGAEKNGTKLYTEVYGKAYPMVYDAQSKRWQESIKDTSGITKIPKSSRESLDNYIERITINDAGYVNSTTVSATKNWTPGSVTVIEVPVTETGTMLIDGNFKLSYANDAELVKVYLNDECVWSNRVGGEESISFDEPYDTKYFIDNIHTVLNVKSGDNLEFRFGKWRNNISEETVDISDVNIRYIEGNVLSKTTKWKLNNSVVVDTQNGKIFNNGQVVSNGAYVENGTTYITSKAANELLGYTGTEGEYVSLRTAAENTSHSVVWAAGRYVIVHMGIPGMYTWNELSEIRAYSELNGGVIYE